LLISQPTTTTTTDTDGGGDITEGGDTPPPPSPPTPPPIRNEYDERNMKFCGSTWGEANEFCSLQTWCPNGDECPQDLGQSCWGGIPNCNAYFLTSSSEGAGGEESNSVGVESPSSSTEEEATATTIQCNAEVHQCPSSGLFVARAPELNCDFYPCPAPSPSSITMNNTTSSSSSSSSYAPSLVVIPQNINSTNDDDVVAVYEPEEGGGDDDDNATMIATNTTDYFVEEERSIVPTMKPVGVWVDNDGEDFSLATTDNNETDSNGEIGGGGGEEVTIPNISNNNLWCGENQFDAIRNCGRMGYDCPNGYCLQNLQCFMVANQCEGGGGGGGTPSDSGNNNSTNNEGVGGEGPTGDVSDTYFCGVTHTDATSSCHKRCRSGSWDECPSGESCFLNVYECPMEIPRPSELIATPPTFYPSSVNMTNSSSIPTDNTFVTYTPTFGANEGVAQPELYCASSEDELEATCSTAQECFMFPCPAGQFCFPYECKGRTSGDDDNSANVTTKLPTYYPTITYYPTTIAAEAQFFCASTFKELETTCSTTAQGCTGGLDAAGGNECPPGQWCYEFVCNTVTLSDAPESNPELNGSMEEESPPPPQQQEEQHSGTSYCASSISQLNERCGLASQCTTDSDCVVQGYFCMKYDCHQNLMQCPLNFVGWHSSEDCKQYYYCEQGVAGASEMCGDGTKFDKAREICTTDYVDEYCYGLDSYENDSGSSITQPGTAKELCPPGFTGWHSSDGACNEYQKCEGGNPGPTRVCGFELKFDTSRGECIDAALVNVASCTGPLPQNPSLPGNDFIDTGSSTPPPPAPVTDLDVFSWSNTPPPTAPQTDSNIPPWMVKKDPNGIVRSTTVHVGLFTVVSIYWMLL